MIANPSDTVPPGDCVVVESPHACYHCGEPCRSTAVTAEGKSFCCAGCRTVFELLTENGLQDFYGFGETAGVKIKSAPDALQFQYLDEPAVRRRVVDFADDRTTRVRFRIPSIHCMACVWLLENLFHLQDGIGSTRVNFARKELSVTFVTNKVRLSEVVRLLASLGYEPELNLADMDPKSSVPASRRLYLQLGVAGFAFGNIMLFGISSYMGLDHFMGPVLRRMFGWMSLLLALPVVIYSASDYWRSAWVSVRGRFLSIDVPIALGLAAFFVRSVVEVLQGKGLGYFDSLSGLVFFLLCGKWFQQKTFDRLTFDRDYRSFFPLSVLRRQGETEQRVALSQVQIGDCLVIRHGELIPADALLTSGEGLVDYSFVTGESAPAERNLGDHLYAGGRQVGAAIEVVTVKQVSQSYLTSLWGQEIFRKNGRRSLATTIDRYSRRFTKTILAIAVCAGVFWAWRDARLAVSAFTSVLIVACPCALALAAPFGFGAAQRILAQRGIFLKNSSVVETLAQADSIVFDKTGTLSAAGAESIHFNGAELSEEERSWVLSLTRQSTHPNSTRIAEALTTGQPLPPVRGFVERPGFGIEGSVDGHEVKLERNVLAIDNNIRGSFELAHGVRPEIGPLLARLDRQYELSLLSGDNDKDRARFGELFGGGDHLHFHQSPLGKLNFIHARQQAGQTVVMVGDGLNDAGALQQSDVGVAVMENINGFSPASDVIIAARALPQLDEALRLCRRTARVVRAAFFISGIYNLAGVSIAAAGLMSPVVCAILMPLSSITVVGFACGATSLAAWRGWEARP